MKKLITLFVITGVLCMTIISCDNGTVPAAPILPTDFIEAPQFSVNPVIRQSGNFGIAIKAVENALDYIFFVQDQATKQVKTITPTSQENDINNGIQYIYFTFPENNFKIDTITQKFVPPYRFGVQAVKYTSTKSAVSWTNYVN